MTCKESPLKAAEVEPMTVEEALEMNIQIKADVKNCEEKSLESNIGEPVKKNETGFGTSAEDVQSRKHSKQNQSSNLMQKCIDCFQIFFHELVAQKCLKDENVVQSCFEAIVGSDTDSRNVDDDDEDLFNNCGSNSSSCDRKMMLDNNEDSLTTFSTACHLLVEFASFPMYDVDIVRLQEKRISKGINFIYFTISFSNLY